MKANPIYVFLHIPKCAGSTLIHHLQNNLNGDEQLAIYTENFGKTGIAGVEKGFRDLSEERKNKIKIIYGHQVYWNIHEFFERPALYLTFMRNPVDRAISHYKYLRRRESVHGAYRAEEGWSTIKAGVEMKTFEEWFLGCKWAHNFMMHIFRTFLGNGAKQKTVEGSLDDVKNVLDDFYFVGLSEHYAADAPLLYKDLGIKNIYPNRNVSEQGEIGDRSAIEQLVSRFCGVDIELYQYAADLRQKRILSLAGRGP